MALDLAIITEKFKLTSMQVAALKARANATSHTEAARKLGLRLNAFWNRLARAVAVMDYKTRNDVWDSFPRQHPKPRAVQCASLDVTMGNV